MGMLKISGRVRGKIMQAPNGKLFMVVEQKGRDIWRGKHRSVHSANTAEEAFVGVDLQLLLTAKRHDVHAVMVIMEDIRRLYYAPLDMWLDITLTKVRPNYQDRANRLLPQDKLLSYYLGQDLKSKRKRANAC